MEIRFHGRGGQGTVVASIILAKAYFKAGYYVQTFPVFGVERRGAPVEAYLRRAHEKILARTNVYQPDHIIVQDSQLLDHVNVTHGLKPNGWILLNAPQHPSRKEWLADYRVAWVDATRIARNNGLGARTQPLINTAMIGAFARVLKSPELTFVSAAIEEEITVKTSANVKAATEAHAQVRIAGPTPEDQRKSS